MSGYGNKFSHTTEESVEQSTSCDTEEQQCWGSGSTGLIVAVVVLVLIWTLAAWGGWAMFNSSNKKCNDEKDGGFGAGCFGVGLLWLIVLILFVGAAYKCGWGAVVGLLVLFLILILIGMWWWSSSCC